MTVILSNGPSKDFVLGLFERHAARSKEIFLAAPYFSYPDPILEALRANCFVNLLIGLNSATHPEALGKIFGHPRATVRYFTGRFHAKIYVFDDAAMLGSANLTQAGFGGNREAVASFDNGIDGEVVDDVRRLFSELWESADVLTPAILSIFKQAWVNTIAGERDPDRDIADAVGRAEPTTINFKKAKDASHRLFLQSLRRKIHEQYGRAFDEVGRVLAEEQLEREQLTALARPFHTNRFLNWVRLTHAPGEDTWREPPLRDEEARRSEIIRLGREWRLASDDRVPSDYEERLKAVDRTFGDGGRLSAASPDELVSGLIGLHAFSEQLRFVKGGLTALPDEFWRENGGDSKRVKSSLDHLLFGAADFVSRLHDVLYSPRWKLRLFGLFCATELAGTIRPDICPPVNGRTAKAMRFVGFDVPGQ